MAPRACVSIPVHEAPAVVLDQVANLRAFLPADTLVVLHVSAAFPEGHGLARLVDDGVLINPVSLPTAWGDTAPAHNTNFRFADAREDFDVFVMHSSNDLFVRGGVEHRLGQAEAGVQCNPIHPAQRERPQIRDLGLAAAHPPLQRLGGGRVLHSQPEGIFFGRELMRRMLDEIEAHLGTEAAPFVDHDTFWGTEHYAYATAAAALTDDIVPPILYTEGQGTFADRPMDEATIWAVREGRFGEREMIDPNDPDGPYAMPGIDLGPPFRRYDSDHLYAVKRIAREYDHPLRALVRAIARAEAGPPPRRRLDDARPLVVAADAAEILRDPTLLAVAAGAVGPDDPVTFALLVGEDRAGELLGRVVAVVEALGLAGDDGPDIAVETVPGGELGHAAMALMADVVLTASHVAGPMAGAMRIGPENVVQLAHELPALGRRAAQQRACAPRPA
jgi:hypothetical protein